MPTDAVRVRFAPSPTGPLHIGGVRTALFNYLFARHHRGVFLVRIEDTDRERSTAVFEKDILDTLTWLNLTWDEPIQRQSERLIRYQEIVQTLIRSGCAYFDESDEISAQGMKDGRAVKLRGSNKSIRFMDLVHGPIVFGDKELVDFVIQKSDGYPTYHLASVVDDYDMRISHVIRGDDHISNTPKHLQIYKALRWKPPAFAHLPLVFGSDRTPLSKRHTSVSLSHYRKEGFLPEALLNYLALLGWSPKNGLEILSSKELVHLFHLKDIHATNACFDIEKLKWVNGEHLKRMPEETYLSAVRSFYSSGSESRPSNIDRIASLLRGRVRTFGEIREWGDYFFSDDINYDLEAVRKHFKGDDLFVTQFKKWSETLEAKGLFDQPAELESLLRRTADSLGLPAKSLIHPTRVAVTGKAVSPSLFDVLSVVGRERVIKRMRYVIIHLSEMLQKAVGG